MLTNSSRAWSKTHVVGVRDNIRVFTSARHASQKRQANSAHVLLCVHLIDRRENAAAFGGFLILLNPSRRLIIPTILKGISPEMTHRLGELMAAIETRSDTNRLQSASERMIASMEPRGWF